MFDAGSVIAKIKADLTEFKAGIEQAKAAGASMGDKIKGSIDGMNSSIKAMTPQLRQASLALGAVAAVGTLMIKSWLDSAGDAEAKMAIFNQTMKNTGVQGEAAKAALLKTAAAAVQLGFDDEDAAVALAQFYQRTKDVTAAQNLLSISQDLARAKTIDLHTATNLVGQALSGNAKLLKAYDIDIKDTATPLEALGILHEKVGGQAAAFMETEKGKAQELAKTYDNFKERLGNALIPVIEKFIELLEKIFHWFDTLSPATVDIIAKIALFTVVVAALLAPLLILITMIPAITAFLGLLSAGIVLLFSPIGILIGLFVALGVLIYKNQQQFKDFFTLIGLYISEFFESARAMFQNGVTFLSGAWNGMMDTIRQVTTSVLDGIKNMFRDGINYLLGLVSSVLDTYNAVVTKVGLGRISAPKVPRLAEGGIVTSPTFAMIGEAGEPEAVIPLSKMGGMGGGIHIHVDGAIIGSVDAAVQMLDMAMRRVRPHLGV